MSEQKHTKEPWWVEDHKNGCLFITSMAAPPGDIADLYGKKKDRIVRKEDFPGEALANGKRIIACVNACQGFSTEALGLGIVKKILAGIGWITRQAMRWSVRNE